MIYYNKIEELQAWLFVKELCKNKKPYEVEDYIYHLTPKELKEQTNHTYDAYDFYIYAFTAACGQVFKNMGA